MEVAGAAVATLKGKVDLVRWMILSTNEPLLTSCFVWTHTLVDTGTWTKEVERRKWAEYVVQMHEGPSKR